MTSVEVDAAGRHTAVTAPASKTDRFFRDARGRETRRRLNAHELSSSSSGSTSSSSSGGDCEPSDDTNIGRLTRDNADGNKAAETAVNPRTQDQTTQSIYGTDLTNSDIATTLLLRHEILPDSGPPSYSKQINSASGNRRWPRSVFGDLESP